MQHTLLPRHSVYHHLPVINTQRIRDCALSLVALQKKGSAAPDTIDMVTAREQTSEWLLKTILNEGQQHSDIVVDRSLSNCLAYNFDNVDNAIIDTGLAKQRLQLDSMVKEFATQWFQGDFDCENTGHFWYPPGAYMSWHTNARTPGWRMYLTLADDEGKSFFRYCNPRSGVIHTSWDKHWDIRLFNVTIEDPLWHCVYSETNRFSFGYKLTSRIS